jgi:hypothetical protein
MRHIFDEFDEDHVGSAIEVDIIGEISVKKDLAERELAAMNAENLESLETLDEEKKIGEMRVTPGKDSDRVVTPKKSGDSTPEKKVKQD